MKGYVDNKSDLYYHKDSIRVIEAFEIINGDHASKIPTMLRWKATRTTTLFTSVQKNFGTMTKTFNKINYIDWDLK